MSTPSLLGSPSDFAVAGGRPGLFRRVLAGMMKAREAQAHRYVSSYLARFSDAHLSELGYTPAEIERLRKQGAPTFLA